MTAKDKAAVPAPACSELLVTGMNCSNCVRHVSEALQGVSGVASAAVDLETKRASVRWAPGTAANVTALVEAIRKAGYNAEPRATQPAGAENQSAKRAAGWHLNLWIGVLGTIPLLLGEWGFGWAHEPWFRWFSFALAAIVQTFAGAPFYRGAWCQFKVGSSSMDTLVALGSTTAFAYSAWTLFSGVPGHLYFMEAAAIITLISVGHWIEARVSAKASSALQALLNLAPALARRRNADGSESQVPLAELQIADEVVVKPGDRVPTDGTVLEGESAVDEAMLTGESVPVDKAARDQLYAGTVNLSGRLLLQVTATGEATALAHIIAVVQRAQTSRANIQRLADRVSNVFVPIVVLVAMAAALWWGLAPAQAHQVHQALSAYLWPAPLPEGALACTLITAAAVLIIACPCAMGLATPAAIMAGSNAAARRGILIRDGIALEKAGNVTAVVFDKTGTLTVGRPEVVKFEAVPGAPSAAGIGPRPFSAAPEPPLRNGRDAFHRVPDCSRKDGDAVERVPTRFKGTRRVISSGSSHPGPQNQGRPPHPIPLPLGGGEGAVSAGEGATRGEPALLALAAALARHSTHPISQAVAKLAADEVDYAEWQEVRGAGVQAKLPKVEARMPKAEASSQGTLFQLGSLKWLGECGVELSAAKAFVEAWSAQGATVLGLAANQSLLGLVAVKDTVKAGASAVVRQLQRQELKTYLVTGDNRLTAAGIARQVGIPAAHVFAEVRPEQKAEFVKQLQQQGERVAFVGDGINDAPALEQADLGIAVSRASDLAREAADIILLKSEIEAVPESLGLARATLRTIKQNLFWAFFYNAVGIPLAALGFMSPVLCAAAMGLSDLIVIGNALRLRNWRR